MDLIFQLIVWLVRSLSGVQQEEARPPEQTRPPGKRGPYNYGDEDNRAPKSLDQLLEDVRREAQQKRGTSPPSFSPQRGGGRRTGVPPVAFPLPQPQRRTLAEESDREEPDELVAPPLPSELKPLSSAAEAAAAMEKTFPALIKAAPSAAAAAATDAAAMEKLFPALIKPAPSGTATADIPAVANLVRALQSARPAARQVAARQAVALLEILGPPRALRRYCPAHRIYGTYTTYS